MFEKWKSDDNLRYRRNAFGRAPYGEPFYIDDDMNIVTGFNDKVRQDSYNYQLYGDDYVPTASYEETRAHYDNWNDQRYREKGSQQFLDNINNPEGYNAWRNKVDSERSMFPSGILGFWNMLGAFDQPTYKEQADLYYSPFKNKSEGMQEYVQSQPQGPLATVNEDYESEQQRFEKESFSEKIKRWFGPNNDPNPSRGRFPADGRY